MIQEERRTFLLNRQKEIIKNCPKFSDLIKNLESVDNSVVVAPPSNYEPDIDMLVSDGCFFSDFSV